MESYLISEMGVENVVNLSYSKCNTFAVSLFMVLCYVGILAQYTIMSQYIYYRISYENKNIGYLNGSQCNWNTSYHHNKQTEIQSEVARYNIYSQLSSGIPSIIAVIIYGILSDLYGRKLIIMISWLGLFIGTILNVSIIWFNLPLWIYILGQFITGLGGNYGTMLTGVLSIISDSTSKKGRNFGIVIIEFTLGVSMVISQLVLGLWLRKKGHFGPIVAFGTSFIVSGIPLFFIEETRAKTAIPNNFSFKSYLYISLIKMKKVFFVNSKFHYLLVMTLFAFFLHTFNFFGNFSLITLYLFGRPFCWISDTLGYYRSISAAIIQLGMFLSLFMIKFRVNEILIIEIGFLTNIMSKILFSVAPSFSKEVADYLIYAASLDLFSGASVSLLRSISSKLVSVDEIGSLFGVMSALETFSGLIGGVLFNLIYKWTFMAYYGICYIFSAFLLFFAFILMILFYYKRNYLENYGYNALY